MTLARPFATTRRFVAPRDIYELRLCRIWESVLHRDGISMKDDFFELGGDHAMVEAVLAAIAAQFASPLAMETFLEGPTIERLTCHLRARSSRLNEETVVALQPNGDKRPFFFLPGGEGNVLNFHDLARRMAPDQPLYGLQTRGLYGDHPLFDRIEDMAADHIESMRAVQPRGPYLLGGHCGGSVVALEMALQLQRRGERVAVLVACDAWSPAVVRERMEHETFLEDIGEFYGILAGGFRAWFGVDIGLKSEALLALEPERRAGYFMDLARKHGAYTPDAPQDRVDRVLSLYRSMSLSGYMPGELFEGTVTCLRATDSKFCETLTEGWEHIATRPLRLRMVPGNHVTLLTEPHVEHLANEMRAAILEAGVS